VKVRSQDRFPCAILLLCYLPLCIPCFVLNKLTTQHAHTHVKSYFRIDYDPLQVLEMIRPSLMTASVKSSVWW
jgi:hypothetical protein